MAKRGNVARMNPKLRSKLMYAAKVAAVILPALGSGVAVNAKSTAETSAGYRALRSEVEAQAKEIDELRADVRELRAALLARVLGSAPPTPAIKSQPVAALAASEPIALPAVKVAGGSGGVRLPPKAAELPPIKAKLTTPMANEAAPQQYQQRQLPKSPKDALDKGL